MARVVINGLAGLQKKLGSLNEKLRIEIVNQVLDSGTQIQLDAVSKAPASFAQRIDSVKQNGGLAAEIGVQGESRIPIYVEFGTGESAASYVPTLPQEIQDYAIMFKEQIPGRTMKRPYLIPAFLRESPIFVKELEKILKKNV